MSSVISAPASLPVQLARLSSQQWSAVTIGQSGAAVWRVDGDHQTLFVKAAAVHGANELPDEVARLEWLARVGFASPRIIELVEAEGLHWLVMTAVPGADLTSMVVQPEALCLVMAQALRGLHALDIANCPFDNRLPRKLDAAAANVSAGWVDEDDFDEERVGWRAEAVLDWVRRHRPLHQDLVVTHGDACVPNVMAANDAFSGVIDCGRLGVADRWQDLALACRSIAHNCGETHVAGFLQAYGAAWDEELYRYYCALDDMF